MLVSQLQSLRSMATTAVLFLLGVKEAAPLKKVSSRASHGHSLPKMKRSSLFIPRLMSSIDHLFIMVENVSSCQKNAQIKWILVQLSSIGYLYYPGRNLGVLLLSSSINGLYCPGKKCVLVGRLDYMIVELLQGDTGAATLEAVRAVLSARPDYGGALLAQLTHSHPAGGHSEESKGAAG